MVGNHRWKYPSNDRELCCKPVGRERSGGTTIHRAFRAAAGPDTTMHLRKDRVYAGGPAARALVAFSPATIPSYTKQTATKRVFKSHDRMARYEFLSTSSSTSALAQKHVVHSPSWSKTLPLSPCPTSCIRSRHHQVMKEKSTRTRTVPTPRHLVLRPQSL